MSGLFNLENGFFSFMGKLWDMILLSIIWVICCIPFVTIGPATAAMYYAVVKVIRRERGYVTKEFFHSFKDNLKVGILSNILFGIVAYILYIDFTYTQSLRRGGESYGDLMFAGFVAISTIIIFVLIFCYPILSRFTVNLKGLFKTSFIIAMKHFPTTFLLVIIVAIFAMGCYIIYPFIFIAPALCCLVSSFLIERVFKKYMPKPEEATEETGRDQWYLE
jgi:uncharacterized membrane protein YesL